MTAVVFYSGLRPSEVAMLRPHALHLPADGWGWIDVLQADDGWDEPAEPKTGRRRVPIPPVLVRRLGALLAERDVTPDALIFRTRGGRRPSQSNWNRSLARACAEVGCGPVSPYAARHACATMMLQVGVPLGEAALWLGHSVETLVSTYIGALQGDDVVARERVDTAFAGQMVTWILSGCWLLPRANGGPNNDLDVALAC